MPTLTINKHYNFSLIPNSVLGLTFNNIKLIAVLDYSTALKFSNVELINKQIAPYLPPGTNTNHTEYSYYLFDSGGKKIVIADVWIISGSVEETIGINYTIRLNNISSSQFTVVRDQLRLLGLSYDIL